MYLLSMFRDHLEPDVEGPHDLRARHSMIYVWKGMATIDGREVDADAAVYASEFPSITAGPQGATLWRWELSPASEPSHVLTGPGIASRLAMARKVKMFELVPTSTWLFRLDCIIGHQGTTGVHAHPGSGIRCMLDGHLRIESDKGESSDNRNPGDVWYEEGAYPLVSTADPGLKATFLRGMVLPPEFADYPETAIWISGAPEGGVKNEGWKVYAQEIVTLT